jgi:aquaporin Z
MHKKYIAEAVGTFTLSFVVLGALSYAGVMPVATPIIAALTLGLFVYTIGALSGSHINPAVTLGLWSVKKVSNEEAVKYVLAQVIGALCAMFVAKWFLIMSPIEPGVFDIRVFVAEALGTFFFVFGIAAVVWGKVHDTMSGMVIGGSLLLGVLIATVAGAGGILNPAVALALGAQSVVYLLAPIVGAIGAFRAYKYLME